MQSSACNPESINPTLNIRIIRKRWSMKALASGIYYQATAASPMFDARKRPDPFNITGGSRTRKSHPKQVLQVPCRELSIIDNHDQGEGVDRVLLSVGTAEGNQIC